MSRMHSFLWTTLLSSGVLAMAGPVSAQHHHGGHHHGGHQHGGHQHHGGHFHGGHHHGGHHHGLHYFGGHHHGYPHHHHYYPYGIYRYGYPTYGYSTTYFPSYVYTVPQPPVAPLGPIALTSNSARVEVLLPDPDAQVWIDGSETSSRGMTRVFESPPLGRGKNSFYTVRASWKQGGRIVTEERGVEVAAGKASVVDFTRPPPPEKVAAPR